jgi:hypothetical protein
MNKEGAPGYVDEIHGQQITLTLFQEGTEYVAKLTAGNSVRVAPTGIDRMPTGQAIGGTVASVARTGKLCKVVVTTAVQPEGFTVTGLARLWTLK